MGNNDSLPPPPPPGVPGQPLQPPHVPLTPPPPPAPPTYAAAPPIPPTPPAPPTAPPPTPSRGPLMGIIIGVVIAAALVGGAIVVFAKKDSPKHVVATTSTSAAPETTTPDTFVITSPATTEPPPTTVSLTPTTADPSADITVSDDTKLFKVRMPGTFQTDTKPIDASGTPIAQVSGSEDLASYNSGHDTPGVTVIGSPAGQLQPPASLVDKFDPGVSVCTDRNLQSNMSTSLGAAEALFIDGCGANGASKVIMAVVVASTNNVFVVIAQGPGPANGNLLQFAQAVLETITPA